MKGIAITSKKGGVGKSSISHLLALGAAWKGVPAHMMHTDDREPIKVNNRPYMFYDCRNPDTLSTIVSAAINQDGLCIIDGGGNRPEFDKWIAASMDLVLIPVVPDPEAVDVSLNHMRQLEEHGANNIRFILNMVSSNKLERQRDFSEYFSLLPRELIIGQIARVGAVKRLRESDKQPFQTPPTNVNNVSRKLFSTVREALEIIEEVV